MLPEAALKLRVRRRNLVFHPGANQMKRPLTHPIWIALSDHTNNEGRLLSVFFASSLWYQRVVQGMEFKVVADYVVPGSKRISVGGAASLSTAQIRRQHISGKPLMDAIHEALLKVWARETSWQHGMILP